MEDLRNKIVDHGFDPKLIKMTPDNYVLGAKKLAAEVIRPNGQWDDDLPVREIQRQHGLETMNCTNYGTLNPTEGIHIARYGVEENWAERFLGVLSETTTRGNSPHKVAETIRKFGCIPEKLLPFSENIDTWEEYYSPKPMTQNYLNIGLKWLQEYDFGHEWVFSGQWQSLSQKQKLLMEALKLSPLGISVKAWRFRNGYYWKDHNESDNHWVCLYGYEEGKYWKVFDSYDNTHKKLEWNYNFGFAKRYHLKKKGKKMLDLKRDPNKWDEVHAVDRDKNKHYHITNEFTLEEGAKLGWWAFEPNQKIFQCSKEEWSQLQEGPEILLFASDNLPQAAKEIKQRQGQLSLWQKLRNIFRKRR